MDLGQSSSGKTHILSRQNDILEKIELISEPEIRDIPPIRSLPLPLSTAKESSENVEVDTDDIDQVLVELPYLAQAQRKDKFCSMIINYLINGLLPKRKRYLRALQRTAHKYWVDESGILRKVDETTAAGCLPPAILPQSLWNTVFDAYHSNLISGHRKFERLYDAIAVSYYFPGMSAAIKGYYHCCLNCAINSKTKTLTSDLNPYMASYPGILLHLDCTKGPKVTARGNSFILAIFDNFSGYIRLYAISDPSAEASAEALLQYVCVNSMPLQIVTDNGSEFANQIFAELTQLLRMKQTFIAPYNSKSNSHIECSHKVTESIICLFVDKYADDWDLLLPLVEFAFNTSHSSLTGYTPFYLHFGRHPIMPIDSLFGSVNKPVVLIDDYVKKLQTEREGVINWVREEREKVAVKQKQQYDKANEGTYTVLKVGDQVLKRNKSKGKEIAKKYRLYLLPRNLCGCGGS